MCTLAAEAIKKWLQASEEVRGLNLEVRKQKGVLKNMDQEIGDLEKELLAVTINAHQRFFSNFEISTTSPTTSNDVQRYIIGRWELVLGFCAARLGIGLVAY